MTRARLALARRIAPVAALLPLVTGCMNNTITPTKPYQPPGTAAAPAPVPTRAEAAIYPSVDAAAETQVRISETTSTLTGTNLRLADLLSVAYRSTDEVGGAIPLMSELRVIGNAPLADKQYDVRIHVPGAKAARLRAELRQALQTSFGLSARTEMREAAVYVLTAPQGRLKEGAGTPPPPDASRVTLTGTDLGLLTEQLEERLGQPVVNETGLNGAYAVRMPALYRAGTQRLDPDATRAALLEQLGLDLVRGRRMIEFLVVEQAGEAAPAAGGGAQQAAAQPGEESK
jgi:uncharacterized protein (TIGR03435 family)